MKKILMALAMTGFAYFSAEAQTTQVACEKSQDKVCRKTKDGVSCYKTKYAENFPVCKGAYGYFICCEAPNTTNSTFPEIMVNGLVSYKSQSSSSYVMQSTTQGEEPNNDMNNEMIAPQSQSYPAYSANSATTYEGYYPKHYIKVCSNTDNVAEANRAPYKGCPAPAYDGPEKNMQRNVNVSSPNASFPQADITGNR